MFPDRLKYASIKPIPKKRGDNQIISLFRPISLLTSFSKIIEKVMFNRFIDHITSYFILANKQYRFITGYSIQHAAFLLIDNILTTMNNKRKNWSHLL
jgi:hypothetical protein